MDKLQITKKYESFSKYKSEKLVDPVEIPAEWSVEKMTTLGYFPTERSGEGELLSVYLDRGVINANDGELGTHPPSEELGKYQVIKPGDLVLNNQQAWRGSLGVSKLHGITSPAYIVFRLSENVDPIYANYLFRSNSIVDQFRLLSKGVGNIQRQIHWQSLKSVRVPLPPTQQQFTAGIFLDKKVEFIDQIIEKKQKQIELLREKRTAVINHAVTKGLDPKAELVDSGIDWIGKIPKGWEVRRVKEFFEIKRGRVISKEEMEDEYQYPVYSSQTKNDGCMGYINTYDFDRSALTWTTDGANAGTVFFREGKFNCTNVCGVLIPRKSMHLKYFAYSVQISATPNKRLDTNGYKIMSNEMKNIAIVVPPESQQVEICGYVDKKIEHCDRAIIHIEKSVELLQEFKSSLISHVVTGKVKI